MNQEEMGGLQYLYARQPYETQEELLRDCFFLLDRRLYLLYKYHAWVGPQGALQNMLGMVVTREQFEENLARAAEITGGAQADDEELEALRIDQAYIAGRLERSDANKLPLLKLRELFAFGDEGLQCVLLALAPEFDKKYEKLYAYLQDDISKAEPGLRLAASLFARRDTLLAKYELELRRILEEIPVFSAEALKRGELRLLHSVTAYLLGGKPTAHPAISRQDCAGELEPLLVHDDIRKKLQRLLAGGEGRSVVSLCGPAESGKKLIIRHALRAIDVDGVFLDAALCGEAFLPLAIEAAMEAVLSDSALVIYHLDASYSEEPKGGWAADWDEIEALLRVFLPWLRRLVLLSAATLRGARLPEEYVMLQLSLEQLGEEERARVFRHYSQGVAFSDTVDPAELATKFHFEAGQIKRAMQKVKSVCAAEERALADAALVHQCCYDQVVHKLGSLAMRLKPAYDWEDIVLPAQQIRLMREACDQMRFRHVVYGEWGFGKRITYGNGLSMLFSGPPGTGKTMGAQVIARQLHMELYKIQISQVVSKYIGETEKNLRAVFQEAKRSNSILFFDECDALFGKRSEVKDSHDRHANVETAYLLQQVEEHEGVTILATNLMQNIDPAFMRRLGFVVHFPFPDRETRKMLYQKLMPAAAPCDDTIDYDFLAEKFNVSGGNIKNIVLNAAFMAASEHVEIGMPHLLRAAVNELKKNEIIVVKEDLREYANLVFE